jgi:hypothetical protein
VFDEVYILFHFSIILNKTGCPLLIKTKKYTLLVGTDAAIRYRLDDPGFDPYWG